MTSHRSDGCHCQVAALRARVWAATLFSLLQILATSRAWPLRARVRSALCRASIRLGMMCEWAVKLCRFKWLQFHASLLLKHSLAHAGYKQSPTLKVIEIREGGVEEGAQTFEVWGTELQLPASLAVWPWVSAFTYPSLAPHSRPWNWSRNNYLSSKIGNLCRGCHAGEAIAFAFM